jgi:streptomycin 6-kinase
VLEFDESRRAMVQELLGRPLSVLGLPVRTQIEVISTTLVGAWRSVPAGIPLRTGAQQAQWLGESIRREWTQLGRPCGEETLERAELFARRRRDAFDASTSVLIHGDAHPANVLEAARGDAPADGFKLVDPDGMLSERAHDLAIPLRDWSHDLLAGNTVALGLEWCSRLGEQAGVAVGPIWEWAFLERVSTGLFMTRLGDVQGARLLAVADRLATVEP